MSSATSVYPATTPISPLSRPVLFSDVHVSSSMVLDAQIHKPRLRESKTLVFDVQMRTFTRSVKLGWFRFIL